MLLDLNCFSKRWSTSAIPARLESVEIAWTQPLIFLLISVLFVLWMTEGARVSSMMQTIFDFSLTIPMFVDVLLLGSSTVRRALVSLARSAWCRPCLVYCTNFIDALGDCQLGWESVERVDCVSKIKRPSPWEWRIYFVMEISFVLPTLLEKREVEL